MVHASVIEARLSHLGVRLSIWFRPEIRELQNILMDNETIMSVVAGRYFGGFALLIATDQRLLLIDKRIPYLTIEDIRYDMISEINFSGRIFDASVRIYTINKQHVFTSIKHKHHLQTLTRYAQKRVMEFRQYQQTGQSSEVPSYNILPPAPISSQAPQALNAAPAMYDYYAPSQPTAQPTLHEHHHIIRQAVGAAAVRMHHHNPNPYTRAPLSIQHTRSLANAPLPD